MSAEPTLPTLGLGDPDLAGCLFSDDEERSEFLQDVRSTVTNRQCFLHEESSTHDHVCSPCSSESEPDRPPSACSTGSSASSNLHASDVKVMSDLSDSETDRIPVSQNVHLMPDTQYLSSSGTFKLGASVSNVDLKVPLQSSSQTYTSVVSGSSVTVPSPSEFSPTADEQKLSCFQSSILSSASSSGRAILECARSNVFSLPAGDPPPPDLVEKVLSVFRSKLPFPWIPVADKCGIHLLQLSLTPTKTVRKQISISYGGEENIIIHCQSFAMCESILGSVSPTAATMGENTIETFCERGCNIVKTLYQYALCVGADVKERKDLWNNIPDAYIDRNCFEEEQLNETCRSRHCEMLITLGNGKRCTPCSRIQNILRKRKLPSSPTHATTNNRFLSPEQMQEKLKSQRDEIRKRDKRIEYLKKKCRVILDDEGINIEHDLHEDLLSILRGAALSPFQEMFLEEQLKCAGKSDKRSHRWHPAMIRLALHITTISPSASEALRDSGAIHLPTSCTLYDYSRPFPPQSGISEGHLKVVATEVSKLEPHKKFVSLIAYEVYTSRNLVYGQSDGALIGYAHLEEVENEMLRLERCMNGRAEATKIHLADKTLAFMVKGLLSDVECLIAAYPCNQLSSDVLYSRSWQIISRLERAGVKVLTMVPDGCSVNHTFIKIHTPITITSTGIIFDTLNFCSPDRRPLFFICNVAHLLKSIRNCLYNSGESPSKTRCLEIDGEPLVWSTIVQLYLHYKRCNLRKSNKLNAQNVFPNAYSSMKVRFAAEVISQAVATDIELQKWPRTAQLVKFLRMHSRFFDCLNGAHSSEHIKKGNPGLAPYRDEEDPRFEWLERTYLGYIESWREQVRALNIPSDQQDKKMLSTLSQQGIEIAIRGFTGATKFMLREAKKNSKNIYVMGRAFAYLS